MRNNLLFAGLRSNKPLVVGLVALLVGVALSFAGITTLFIFALVYVLAIGVPYPPIFASWVSRAVGSFLLAFSLVQVAAAVQFFIVPTSGFGALSLIGALLAGGLVFGLYARLPAQHTPLWDSKDTAAALAILCFIVPFAILCFWKNDPANITAFASAQSMDGASHYIGLAEMGGTQHLNYQTAQYYPKGFHIAQALVMNALHIHQKDLNWEMNARAYVFTYMAWGAVLMYVVFYAACQLLAALFDRAKQKLPVFLLAAALGPVVALLYLLPFTHEGFLNYFYICAAVVCGVLFLHHYHASQKNADWFMVAYLLLAFGVGMSWGPLLTPFLLAAPVLYIAAGETNLKKLLMRVARQRWVMAAFLLQLVPLYLHLKYAKLSSEQGLNATGGITAFHIGLVLAGLALVLYVVLSGKVAEPVKRFASYLLIPFMGLVGLFASIQYIMVGELRYYAIKTSYLLELLLLALAVALLVYVLTRSSLDALRRWCVGVVVFGLSVVLLLGLTANPFAITRQMFSSLAHHNHSRDLEIFTILGREAKLGGTNSANLHYNPASGTLSGNALIVNWTNLMQYNSDSTPQSAACTGSIFSILTFPTNKPGEQDTLKQAVSTCIVQALARNRPYFIVTDTASVPYLRQLFGDAATYMY